MHSANEYYTKLNGFICLLLLKGWIFVECCAIPHFITLSLLQVIDFDARPKVCKVEGYLVGLRTPVTVVKLYLQSINYPSVNINILI